MQIDYIWKDWLEQEQEEQGSSNQDNNEEQKQNNTDNDDIDSSVLSKLQIVQKALLAEKTKNQGLEDKNNKEKEDNEKKEEDKQSESQKGSKTGQTPPKQNDKYITKITYNKKRKITEVKKIKIKN